MKPASYEIEIDSDGFQKVKGRRSRTAHAVIPKTSGANQYNSSSLRSDGAAEKSKKEPDSKCEKPEEEPKLRNGDTESEWESTEASSNTLTSIFFEDQQNRAERSGVKDAKAEIEAEILVVGASPETGSETKNGSDISPQIKSNSLFENIVVCDNHGYTTESGMDVDSEEIYEDAVQYVRTKIFDEDGFQLVPGRRVKNMSQINVVEKANPKSQINSNGKKKNRNPPCSAATAAKSVSPYTILLTVPDKPGKKRNRKRASSNGLKDSKSDIGSGDTPQAKQA